MEFKVHTNKLKTAASGVSGVAAGLKHTSGVVHDVMGKLPPDDAFQAVKRSLGKVEGNIDRYSDHVKKIKTALDQISVQYSKTEKDIVTRGKKKSKLHIEWLPAFPFIIGPLLVMKPELIGPVIWGTSHGLDPRKVFRYYTFDSDGNIRFDPDRIGVNGDGEFEIYGHRSETEHTSLSQDWLHGSGNFDASLLDENGRLKPELYAEGDLGYSLLHGEANYEKGPFNGNASFDLMTGAVSGSVAASLLDKDGNFDPRLNMHGEASASVLEGEAHAGVGNDQFGANVEAEGKVLTAEASADVSISRDEVKVEAEAGAYLAEGKVGGDFSVLGIKIYGSVEGHAGGAGAEAGADVTGTSASGKLGAGLGIGATVEVGVDWSNSPIYQKYNQFKSWLTGNDSKSGVKYSKSKSRTIGRAGGR